MKVLSEVVLEIQKLDGVNSVYCSPRDGFIWIQVITGNIQDGHIPVHNYLEWCAEDVFTNDGVYTYNINDKDGSDNQYTTVCKLMVDNRVCEVGLINNNAPKVIKSVDGSIKAALKALDGVEDVSVKYCPQGGYYIIDVKGGNKVDIARAIWDNKAGGTTTCGTTDITIITPVERASVRFNYTEVSKPESTIIDVGLLRAVAEQGLEHLDAKAIVSKLITVWGRCTNNILWIVGETPSTIVVSGDTNDYKYFKDLCENFLPDGVIVWYVE